MLKTIETIISSGESLTTEFKQSFDKEAIETVSAFANTKGKYFKRVQNSNHQMNLTEMHLESLQLSWDAYEAQDTSLEELDFDKIDRFFAKIKASGKFKLSDAKSTKT